MSTVAASCAAKAYDGDARPPSDIAIVRYDTKFTLIASRRAQVISVDGVEISTALKYSVELAPGFHTLKIGFQDVRSGLTRVGTNPCWISRYFHAGREYQIESETDSKIWQARIIDKSTGEVTDCVFAPPGREA